MTDTKKMVRDRITTLRIKKDVSEREMSLSMGKNPNYIHLISSGKAMPTIESLFEICDYFKISMSEFFDSDVSSPIVARKIIKEAERITNNNLEKFLEIIELFSFSDFQSFVHLLDVYLLKNRNRR